MAKQFTEVEFGGQKVKVPKGGYYDRFRMNPDLDEVAKDPAVGNIGLFRRIPKVMTQTRVGPTWAPNFYYRTSNVQTLMLAPMKRLRSMLPAPLEPLRALPGYGLVALTFFSYAVCDNDPYNEVSVAVVIRRPGARGLQTLEFIDSMRRQSFFAHVLALPSTRKSPGCAGSSVINCRNGLPTFGLTSRAPSRPALRQPMELPTRR
ncbi:MAG: hypothetical protein QM744_03630 [Mesorhizobium sp.]